MGCAQVILNALAAGFALLAGVLWFAASRAQAPVREEPDDDGLTPFVISREGKSGRFDVLETAELQTKWNARAALCACAAALFQFLGLTVTLI